MSVLDSQTVDFQLRAANGRLTPADVCGLPDSPLPRPFDRLRSLDETVSIVARAVHERFRIGVCDACGGTEVYSKRRPIVRCLRCGVAREVSSIMPVATRRRCQQCKKFFRSVTRFLKCPDCRARGPVEPEASPTRIKPQA